MSGLGLLFLHRTDVNESAALKEAMYWFTKALEIERNARILTFLGNTSKAMNYRDDAVRYLEEAIQLDRNYEEAYFILAKLEKESRPEVAKHLLRRAIDIDPEYLNAHQELGNLLHKEGDILGAEHHFRRCVEIQPNEYWSR